MPHHDLVVASYVLSELPDDKERRATVRSLWESTAPGGIVVFVEPGTPVGFRIIRDARAQLLGLRDQGDYVAHPVAPVSFESLSSQV